MANAHAHDDLAVCLALAESLFRDRGFIGVLEHFEEKGMGESPDEARWVFLPGIGWRNPGLETLELAQ